MTSEEATPRRSTRRINPPLRVDVLLQMPVAEQRLARRHPGSPHESSDFPDFRSSSGDSDSDNPTRNNGSPTPAQRAAAAALLRNAPATASRNFSPESDFPFPAAQRPSHRHSPERHEQTSTKLHAVEFNPAVLTRLTEELIVLQGPFIGPTFIQDEPLSQGADAHPETPEPQCSHLPSSSDCVAAQDFDASLDPVDPVPEVLDPHKYLEATFSDHAKTLFSVTNPAFGSVYKAFCRIRIYNAVKDSPVSEEAVLEWLGFDAIKTFQNMRSRFSRADDNLRWLRKQNNLNDEDTLRRNTLNLLLHGPFIDHPPARPGDVDSEEDGGEEDESGGADVMTHALQLKLASLDRWNADFRKRRKNN